MASFESKLIYFRNTFCVHRSLHPEQKSIIFCKGDQTNKEDMSYSNKSIFTTDTLGKNDKMLYSSVNNKYFSSNFQQLLLIIRPFKIS